MVTTRNTAARIFHDRGWITYLQLFTLIEINLLSRTSCHCCSLNHDWFSPFTEKFPIFFANYDEKMEASNAFMMHFNLSPFFIIYYRYSVSHMVLFRNSEQKKVKIFRGFLGKAHEIPIYLLRFLRKIYT